MKSKIEIILRGGPPYGFRIQGGKEFGSKVRIAKIEPNSKASQCDMKINDLILFINTVSTSSILHTQALALLRAPSQFVTLVLERDDEFTESINNIALTQDNSNLSIRKVSNNESNTSVCTMETISSSPTNDGSNFRRNSFGRNSDWYKKMFKELHVVGTDDHHLKNFVDKQSNQILLVDRNSSNLRRQRSQSVSDLTDKFQEKLSFSNSNASLKNKEAKNNGGKSNKSIEDTSPTLKIEPYEDRSKEITKNYKYSPVKLAVSTNVELNSDRQKSTYIDFHNRQIYDSEVSKKDCSSSAFDSISKKNENDNQQKYVVDNKDKIDFSTKNNLSNVNQTANKPPSISSVNLAHCFSENSSHESNEHIKFLHRVQSLYKFNGINEKELSFNKNDIITVNEIIDENWYMGRLGNTCGIFPKCYVKKIEETEKKRVIPLNNCNKINYNYDHIALFNYYPKQNDEIMLIKGCKVKVIQKYGDGWYKGTNEFDEKIGMFPGNFVSKIL